MSDNLPSPAVAADTPVWYYVQNKKKVGPVTFSTLQQLAATGQLHSTDMLWREGTTEWVAAASVPGLFAQGNPTAAPPTGRPGPAPGRETKDASKDAALQTPPPAQPGTIPGQGRETPAAGPPSPYPAIPGYEILGVLGRGGMGVVYQARHLALKRLVALKMILSGAHAGEQDLARFRTEAEAVAKLQHPNIVQIFEVGEHEGRPFFSLEFVDGPSLDKRLAGTPLPPAQAAALAETLARAMHYAHQRNIIHRDLKPANVLLLESGISEKGVRGQGSGVREEEEMPFLTPHP